MPSPTSTTVPTLRVSVAASNESIDDLMMLVISSERMAMRSSPVGLSGRCRRRSQRARDDLVPQPLEAAADAAVDQSVPDADDEPAEQAFVDIGLEGDPSACHLLETGGQGPHLAVGEGRRACRGRVGDPLAEVVEPAELGGDPRELLDATTLDEDEDEVPRRAGQSIEDALGDAPPLVERQRRVLQHGL